MFKYYNSPDVQSNIETPAKSGDKDQDFFAVVDNVLRHHNCDKCDVPDKSTEKPMDTILEYKEIDKSIETPMERNMDDQKAGKSIDDKPMDTTMEYKEIIVSLPEYQIKFLEQKSKERFIPSELIRRLLDKQMDEEFFKN